MNERCIFYIALYCVLLYTQSAVQSCGGGLSSTITSVQHPLGWCDGWHRTTAPVRSPHTSYRWRGERVIEPIKCMGNIRRLWLTRASVGNLARTPRSTPLLFTRSAMGFLMTTESQDLGLSSHPKDGAGWFALQCKLQTPILKMLLLKICLFVYLFTYLANFKVTHAD